MNAFSLPQRLLLGAAAIAWLFPVPGNSQLSSNVTVLTTGLNGPRGLKFGPDGLLYVAEGGTGGTTSTAGECAQVIGPIGPYVNGKTARISRIDAQGNRTTLATGFPSAANSAATHDIFGVADLAFGNGKLYALLTGGGCSHGSADIPNGVAEVSLKDGSWKIAANLSTWVAQNPAANIDVADFEPDGAFYSMIASGDRLYAVEANHGQLISIGADGIREELDASKTQGHMVPTAIAESDGFFYLGGLSTFPLVQGSARLLTLNYLGAFHGFAPGLSLDYLDFSKMKVVSSLAGFTCILSITFGPDGLLYVLEFSDQAGYPAPGLGKVVRVKAAGTLEDVATGLSLPTAMTFGPDRKLYVSNWGGGPPGAGQIVRVDVP